MRQRLSWDKEKVAEMEKKADPYTMNQQRTNPPAGKYDIGGPSEFAEDPNMKTPWKQEGRVETGHPAPVREAVVAARRLEDKALKCVTIAQRMLPGADDDMIEKQAMDLMYLPENSVIATLQRQASFAKKIAGEEEKEEEEKDAAKKEETPEEEKKDAGKAEEKKEMKEEEKDAAKKKETPEEEKKDAGKAEEKKEMKEEEKAAAKKEETPEEEKKDAGKAEEKKEEEEKDAAKKEETPEEEKKAADKDILDIIFDNAVEAAVEAPKAGVKKLSGIVKQASTGMDLNNLWDAPPDVSSVFK